MGSMEEEECIPTPHQQCRVSFRRSRLHPALGGACAVARAATMALLLAALLIAPAPARSASPLNAGNPDAKRLYDDLLSNYNKLVRPVVNSTDRLTVRIKLKLSQLIDVVSQLDQHQHCYR